MKRYILLLLVMQIMRANIIYPGPASEFYQEIYAGVDVRGKTKKYHRLCVNCLNVTDRLVVNGQEITGNGSGTFAAAYGQLTLSPQEIEIIDANTWIPVPFDGTGPTVDVTTTTSSPATMTIQKNGVYQTNCSLYFSAAESDEGAFNSTVYTLGLNVNGVTTPVAAVTADVPGSYSLNYNTIMALSENDYVQFYLEVDTASAPPFDNNVMLENGNAYVTQIAG